MSAKKLNITDRSRERMSAIASLDNFTWHDAGDSFDASTIVDNPNVSLYCLDDAHQWAVFVMLPDGIDLSQAPFVYLPQLEQAQFLIAVSYDEFLQLADELNVDACQLTCIHNIGRCGSTLLCQALNEIDGVVALSEPDVFASFITIRQTTSHPDQIRLLRACFKMMYRADVSGDATHYVLKLRNQGMDIIDLYAEAFPEAKHLFMYRNLVDWLASIYRFIVQGGNADRRFTRQEAIEKQVAYLNRKPDEIASFYPTDIMVYSYIGFLTISLLTLITRYVEETNNPNFNPIAIRYEDLTSHPKAILMQVFNYLNLPVEAIDSALVAFKRDSQAGTRLARDNAQIGNKLRLEDTDLQTIQAILNKQPIITRPDIILPNTILLQ